MVVRFVGCTANGWKVSGPKPLRSAKLMVYLSEFGSGWVVVVNAGKVGRKSINL